MKLATYYSLTHDERSHLRRKVFGNATLNTSEQELKDALIAENEATGWFPGRWVDGDDELDALESV
ncbi:MAG: hypothetical protein H0V63_13330 [Burkholderiaceae bacterium]|nr:hypothetical protein [Burkholderiaceae bacterium]